LFMRKSQSWAVPDLLPAAQQGFAFRANVPNRLEMERTEGILRCKLTHKHGFCGEKLRFGQGLLSRIRFMYYL